MPGKHTASRQLSWAFWKAAVDLSVAFTVIVGLVYLNVAR